MEPGDLFPIERCSKRLKAAILAEFNGLAPTYQEILRIPLKEWMTVPGIGPSLLKELQSILHNPSIVGRDDSSMNSADAGAKPIEPDLIARLERLQRDLKKLQDDIQALMSEGPTKQDAANGSDLH